MARNGDETGAGGESAGWLGHVCARLKAKVDEALDAVCDAPKVEGVAEAEKLARAVGVIARAAKAVAALEPRLAADSEEDEMGGRIYDPEEDERIRRQLAVEPWRAMQVHAGATAGSLTPRATVETPATVGRLVQALEPGVRHRWDEANSLLVAVEGRAPESAAEAAVLAGGNLVAVEAGDGWELLQFREATLVGAGLWRLSGLLRGQQGTDEEAETGAEAGAIVVFLGAGGLARARVGREERGLSLLCRTGPSGSPPGGAGLAETTYVHRGLHHRPWRVAGLAVDVIGGDRTVLWTPRARLFGDSWEGETAASDPERYRVEILKDGAVVRSWEATEASAVYAAADRAADFAGGGDGRVRVAQWGEAFGWGVAAEIALP